MRLIRKLLALVVFSMGAALLGTAAYMYSYEEPGGLPRASAIVVLSGPGALAEIPIDETRERVERGVALWKDGTAPLVVMSGGGATLHHAGVPNSLGMTALAGSLGVPESALVEEPASHSTLQNAWFTAELPVIDPSQPVIVVTHRYHLPRAWASFRWAGFQDVTLVAADSGPPEIDVNVMAEAIKWPLNIVRALGAKAALLAGQPEADVLAWLE